MAKFKSNEDLSFLQNLYAQLTDLSGGEEPYAKRAVKYVKGGEVPANVISDAFLEHPFKTKVAFGNGATGNSLKNTLGMAKSAIKANPWQTAGLGAMGIANVAGLTDNDKVGGQLVGSLAGGVIPAVMGANPMTAIALGLGGGTLGSLFDKLRAKKETEQQGMYQEQSY